MMKVCDQNENEIFKIELHEYKKMRIHQGDIIKNVENIEYIKEEEGVLSISLIIVFNITNLTYHTGI